MFFVLLTIKKIINLIKYVFFFRKKNYFTKFSPKHNLFYENTKNLFYKLFFTTVFKNSNYTDHNFQNQVFNGLFTK